MALTSDPNDSARARAQSRAQQIKPQAQQIKPAPRATFVPLVPGSLASKNVAQPGARTAPRPANKRPVPLMPPVLQPRDASGRLLMPVPPHVEAQRMELRMEQQMEPESDIADVPVLGREELHQRHASLAAAAISRPQSNDAALSIDEQTRLKVAVSLGLSDPLDGLLIAPDRYEDYRNVNATLSQMPGDGEAGLFVAKVRMRPDGRPSIRGFAAKGERRKPKSGYLPTAKNGKLELVDPFEWPVRYLEIGIEDMAGEYATIMPFGSVRVWRDVPVGVPLMMRGKLKVFGRRIYINDPEWVPEARIGEIQPVYVGPAGSDVKGEVMGRLVDWIFQDEGRLQEALMRASASIRADCGQMDDADILSLCAPDGRYDSLDDFLLDLHRPQKNVKEGMDALVVARSICMLSMQCQAQAANSREPSDNAPMGERSQLLAMAREVKARFEATCGYTLTANQTQIIEQAVVRFADREPLNGLLNGEVGAGKTAVFGILAAVAHKMGVQVAVMAPTDLLADQHAIRLGQVLGGDIAIERVKTGRKIHNPSAILIGTSGLATLAHKYGVQPGFLVLDEQHKLHTQARASLVCAHTHTLEVSATPIPRTMALSMYRGMDVYMLSEQPVKRDIETQLVDHEQYAGVMNALRQTLAAGQRAALVFSLVDPNGKATSARTSVEEAAQGLERHFPGLVSVLHGKMKDDEKQSALAAFNDGERPLLVTTSIFETGIDVADVRLLIVRDPDSMGLNQLHQLRGRLARNGGKAVCFLLARDLAAYKPETLKRLQFFCKHSDGYELAREDLRVRGAGQFAGTAQSGRSAMTFKAMRSARAADFVFDEQADIDIITEDAQNDALPQAPMPVPLRPAAPRQRSLF